MEEWLVSMKRADFQAIASRFNIDPVTARLIRNRGLTAFSEIDKYLNGTLNDLYPPSLMKDMDKACGIILKKISLKKRIRIIGDYDIDGIMSTYILLTGLKLLGADVDEKIPERIRDGYGLNENLVINAHNDSVDTITTCDNGISAYAQISLAKELGMTVIVTDHHEVPFDAETSSQIIPPADAVVDPKQDTCGYPFKGLCGAAVAWKLISVLFERSGISRDKIILDPGVGFAKSYEQNLEIISRLEIMHELGCPVLLGTSRKSVIGLTLDLPADQRTFYYNMTLIR